MQAAEAVNEQAALELSATELVEDLARVEEREAAMGISESGGPSVCECITAWQPLPV